MEDGNRAIEWSVAGPESPKALAEILAGAASHKAYILRGRQECSRWRNSRLKKLFKQAAPGEELRAIFIDMSQLSRIMEFSAADQVISLESGIELNFLNEFLAEHGLWLPIDPRQEASMLIDAIESGDAGYPETAYSGVRHLILGMEVSLSTGDNIGSGGKIVKNVTGYDTSKLMIGSRSWLGIVHTAHLRLYTTAPFSQTFLIWSDNCIRLLELCREFRNSGLPLSALELFDTKHPAFERFDNSIGRSCCMALSVEGRSSEVKEITRGLSSIISSSTTAGFICEELDSETGRSLDKLGTRAVAFEPDTDDSSIAVELFLSNKELIALMSGWWQISTRPAFHIRPLAGRLRLRISDLQELSSLISALAALPLGTSYSLAGSSETLDYCHWNIERSKVHDSSRDLLYQLEIDRESCPLASIATKLKNSYDPAGVLNPLFRP